MLVVGCSLLPNLLSPAEIALVSARHRITCPSANGGRIQTAPPLGSPAPAGAVIQFAGPNGGLAAQTPALG
jgi:hypothetical protein